MILSIHQPAYLPWLGYFNKLSVCDIFVFLDTVQFERNSFINRNRIKTSQGETWLTVPVHLKNHLFSNLLETRIDNSTNWQKKHLNSIFLNYKKALFFEEVFSLIEPFYLQKYDLLSDFCHEFLTAWLQYLKIGTRVVRSSSLKLQSRKSNLVLELCRYFQADRYISGAQGRNYLQEDDFSKFGITVMYQNYKSHAYRQLWGEFVPCMGVIDAAMNLGRSETLKLIGRGWDSHE